MKNPFSLTFGKEPLSLIKRNLQNTEIIEGFQAENPVFQVCMLTGVRGSGKTVALTTIANTFKQDSDWIVVDLNPERNLLSAWAAELSNRPEAISSLELQEINVSAFGIGIGFKGNTQGVQDVSILLNNLLAKITQAGKKVLVTIDEVIVNQNIKEFISQFQIFMRKNYNIFLLMTGLYENIYDLQNEKSLTFLYRAPKVELQPLSLTLIMHKYQEIFELTDAQALAMAKITNGYPFAYQVLGYLCFKEQVPYTDVLYDFDNYLEEYVYDKIWHEMSATDKQIALALCQTPSSKVADIREALNMDSNKFTVYRKRLLKKGIVHMSSYGHLTFILPRFKEFVLRNYFF